MFGRAVFSEDGNYRYRLERRWGDGSSVCFVMCNPSVADAVSDDATISRCVRFARSWGYAGLTAVNLYAFRATLPRDLFKAHDPVGPLNDDHIVEADRDCALTVVAWGTEAALGSRAAAVLGLLRPDPHCLAIGRAGAPVHPLYQRGCLVPTPFEATQSTGWG